MNDEDLIRSLYQAGCIRFGRFTLVSGKESAIYIDLRLLISEPALLRRVAQKYALLLQPLQFDRLAAVPYAALPIGTAVALEMNRPLIYAHKYEPTPGVAPEIEGDFSSGMRVAIIEDLVTKGGSVLKAAKRLEDAGLAVTDLVVLLDREQGARQILSENGYRLHAAFSLSRVLDTLLSEGHITQQIVNSVRADMGRSD